MTLINTLKNHKMDKDFIENCKLLKKHFTQLTQTDTATQSNQNLSKTTSASNVIDEARRLLLFEQLQALSDQDIAQLREKSVSKYAKTLENITSTQNCRKSLCQTNRVHWNDEIFLDSVPNPKNNNLNNKLSLLNEKSKENEDFERLQELFNELQEQELEIKKKIERKNTKIEKKISEIIEVKTVAKQDVISKQMENEQIFVLKEIPELKITPQQNSNVENLLEVKKISMESPENKWFDTNIEENKEQEMLQQTITKWKIFTKEKKIKEAKHNKKIDNFLDNIQKYKISNTVKSKSDLVNRENKTINAKSIKVKPKSSNTGDEKVSSYEFRFKAQKDIIETQKAKLEEQKRIIEDLKLNRIQKQAQESLDKAQTEYQKTISTSKFKYRVKSDQKTNTTETNATKSETNDLNLSLNLSKAPKMVQQMEERAKEREERRILIKERKRLIEEEKKKQAEEAIQRKMKEENEEKHRRIERMKRQRELVRQLEIKKQLEKKRFIAINQMAFAHYRKKLMQNYGLKYFKMLIYSVKIKTEISKRFYETNLVIKCFKNWKIFTTEIINYKNNKALINYNTNLCRKIISQWKIFRLEAVQLRQVADDRYELSLMSKIFVNWHKLVCDYHMQFGINAVKADKHYRRILLFQCLHSWRSLPAILEIERIQNERKRKWRLRVAEILTDYDPLKNYN